MSVETLALFVESHEALTYFLIFLGLIFEGEFIIIFTGILSHLQAVDFSLALLCILAGAGIKTLLGYQIGKIIYKKWSKARFIRYMERRVHGFLPRFRRKPFWSIFLSKFILGANHLVIIYSGFLKINYKKFLRAETIATLIWAPGLLILGYFFSYTALHVTKEIKEFTLIIIVFVVVFIVLDKLLGWLYGLVGTMLNGNGDKE